MGETRLLDRLKSQGATPLHQRRHHAGVRSKEIWLRAGFLRCSRARESGPQGGVAMGSDPLEDLRAQLAEKVTFNPYILETHGRCESYPEARPPLAVVFAESVQDVQLVLAWASTHHIAVIPFGAGTSLEAQLLPQGSAISLDLSRLSRLLELRPQDFLAVVEAGLTYPALTRALERHGLFFPVDPGAEATLGGMAATNASGTTTIRYGGMRQNVLALEVVLASGEVLQVGRPVQKTSSGYDLKDLFIGSEGTLGVITKLTVRLHPRPVHVHTIRAVFPNLDATVEGATLILASGLPVARLEMVDELGMRAVNRYLNRTYPESPALFLEFHSGTAAAIGEESREVQGLLDAAGALSVDIARTPLERDAQWEARHKLYWALIALFPGCSYMITDTAVPLTRLPEMVTQAQRLLADMDLPGSIVGHVGEGNFHTLVAVAPADYPRAEQFAERVAEAAVRLGGTISGEHGVGLRKRRLLHLEHGPAVEWMRRVKDLFDPQGILNPGKIF